MDSASSKYKERLHYSKPSIGLTFLGSLHGEILMAPGCFFFFQSFMVILCYVVWFISSLASFFTIAASFWCNISRGNLLFDCFPFQGLVWFYCLLLCGWTVNIRHHGTFLNYLLDYIFYLLKCSPVFLFAWKLHSIGFVFWILCWDWCILFFMDEFTDNSLTPCMSRLNQIATIVQTSVCSLFWKQEIKGKMLHFSI